MWVVLLALGSAGAFILAYRTYGRWLGRRVFALSVKAVAPSVELEDGRDYVPTPTPVVFGHHFTSIAGTGPIVGPAIAVMWGWLPALLWVVFGSIFIGAVHDFGSLVVSLRHKGQTVGQIAGKVIHPRVRTLFLLVLLLALVIILAIFGLVIAAVFRQYPQAIAPCLLQIPLAVAIGSWLRKTGGGLRALTIPSLAALGLMYAAVVWGDVGALGAFNAWAAGWPLIVWVAVLLVYAGVASVLPVWTLLQPRDYINSLQLVSAMGLLVLGLLVAGTIGGAPIEAGADRPPLELVAPVYDFGPAGAPLLFPFLFITIACGAISGFHCLVSSGTSSKQLQSEPAARAVGYGGMLLEGFLAVLVIVACCAGLGLGAADGAAAWSERYAGWGASNTLGAKVAAFVDGSANLLASLGIGKATAVALMGVLVASFAGTTLDTATRLQRYVIQELFGGLADDASPVAELDAEAGARAKVSPVRRAFAWLGNPYAATAVAILTAGALAAMAAPGVAWSWKAAGTGGLILWPMFGATNQLIGGLAFLVIAFWLVRQRKPVAFLIVPLAFMLVMPAWALGWSLFVGSAEFPRWLGSEGQSNPVLIAIAIATLALEVWMVVEAIRIWPRARRAALDASADQAEAEAGPDA
ncbi:MAG: carbon starvation CstA family protein [Planctomycetota bacterium]